MINFDFEQNCCGCASCENSCPTNAIKMVQNGEGFQFPRIDETLCIKCGKCERACPYLNAQKDSDSFSEQDFTGKKSYLFFDKSDDRINSTSGGFLFALGKKIISNGGLVCGCVWDENLVARHVCTDSTESLRKMQSSKYVQSRLGTTFLEIKNALKDGRQVLFGGTPCQTAALYRFLGGKNPENLILACVICHGVPSPLVWERYKSCLEKKYNSKLVDVNLRDKSYKGYAESYCKYTFEDESRCGKYTVGWSTYLYDPYVFLFTDNLYLRKSCSHCRYKSLESHADIIVGDFYASVQEAGNLGCSGLIAMTPKGEKNIFSIDGFLKPVDVSAISHVNNMLWKSSPEHKKRAVFFKYLKSCGEGDWHLFNDFLPLRFKVKKTINRIGLFKYWKKIKQILRKG